MNVVLQTLIMWRIGALAVWAVIAIGAADIVVHIFDAHPHRHRHGYRH